MVLSLRNEFAQACSPVYPTSPRGPYPQKNDKVLKKKFFASNEVSTCSGCCCGILHLCDVCKGGLRGVERHYNPSVFKKCVHKNRSHEKFQFCNF